MQSELKKTFAFRLALVKFFDKICQLNRWRKLDQILENAAQTSKDFLFVQIGANDGVIYDPINRFVNQYNWKGVLVEPVKSYFDQLTQNYHGLTRLRFENAAISSADGQRQFYRIKDGIDFLPSWCNGLGTFHLDVLLTHKWAIPNIEDYVVAETVTTITLASLLKKYAIDELDLLVIDTEGHDYEIIRQIDFDRLCPKILLYEHQYIDPADRSHCQDLLKNRGYELAFHQGNTLAYWSPRL